VTISGHVYCLAGSGAATNWKARGLMSTRVSSSSSVDRKSPSP